MNKKRLDVFIVVLMAITGFAIGAIAGFSAKNDVENALTETTVSQETITEESSTVEETTEIELTTVKYEDIPKFRELDRFYITGYTPTCTHCCGKADGIGASGRKIVVGESVAMNRTDMKNFGLEYGNKIYIEGIGERVIVDTGCGQGVVDVACDSHESCNDVTGYYRVHYVIE
jgi:3D (Asp-Asp-Asp) domain-containing protein